MVGIEPTTYGLRNRCSTTELHWHQGARVWHRLTCTDYSKALSGAFVKGGKCGNDVRNLSICGSGSRQEDLLCGDVIGSKVPAQDSDLLIAKSVRFRG
jgi:hypothetical protein